MHFFHGHAGIHHFMDLFVRFDIEGRTRFDYFQTGTGLARLRDLHAGIKTEAFRFVTYRDATSGLSQNGRDRHRTMAQLRPHLLLHRSKVGIKIDKKRTERHYVQ